MRHKDSRCALAFPTMVQEMQDRTATMSSKGDETTRYLCFGLPLNLQCCWPRAESSSAVYTTTDRDENDNAAENDETATLTESSIVSIHKNDPLSLVDYIHHHDNSSSSDNHDDALFFLDANDGEFHTCREEDDEKLHWSTTSATNPLAIYTKSATQFTKDLWHAVVAVLYLGMLAKLFPTPLNTSAAAPSLPRSKRKGTSNVYIAPLDDEASSAHPTIAAANKEGETNEDRRKQD
jgi:hypothetical protein